jgi:hypothetical protein
VAGAAGASPRSRLSFAQYRPRRDRALMGLTLGVGDVHQVRFAQARRQLQHRTRDGDVIVAGKRSQHPHRRIRQRRQMNGQFGAGVAFNVFNEKPEDVVKQVDVQFTVGTGPIEKQRRKALQGVDALLARPMDNDLFEFRNQRQNGTHCGISNRRQRIGVEPIFLSPCLITDYRPLITDT